MGLHARPLQGAQVKSVVELRFPHAMWCGQKKKNLKITVIFPLACPSPTRQAAPSSLPTSFPLPLSFVSQLCCLYQALSPVSLCICLSLSLCLSDSVPLRLCVSSSLPLLCPKRPKRVSHPTQGLSSFSAPPPPPKQSISHTCAPRLQRVPMAHVSPPHLGHLS